MEIDKTGAYEIARRSRGTPRLANRLLKRVRDFAQVKYNGVITKEVADFALDILDVDKLGLDNNDRAILHMIIDKFPAVRSDWRRWRQRWARMLGHWKMCMSHIF